MKQQEIIGRTLEYIRENFLYTRPDLVVGEDDHLMETGVVDSMGMVELLQFLEDTFGIKAHESEMTEQNLATLRRIADYVASKQGQGAAAA